MATLYPKYILKHSLESDIYFLSFYIWSPSQAEDHILSFVTNNRDSSIYIQHMLFICNSFNTNVASNYVCFVKIKKYQEELLCSCLHPMTGNSCGMRGEGELKTGPKDYTEQHTSLYTHIHIQGSHTIKTRHPRSIFNDVDDWWYSLR